MIRNRREAKKIDIIVSSILTKIFFSKRKRVFDVLLNLHASASANFISMAIRAERKIGYDKARARDKQNWFCDEYIQPASNQHVADAMIGFQCHNFQIGTAINVNSYHSTAINSI